MGRWCRRQQPGPIPRESWVVARCELRRSASPACIRGGCAPLPPVLRAVPLLVTRDAGSPTLVSETQNCLITTKTKGLRLCRIGPCVPKNRVWPGFVFFFYIGYVSEFDEFKPTQKTYRTSSARFLMAWHRKYGIFKPFSVLVNGPFGSIRDIRHVFFPPHLFDPVMVVPGTSILF